MTNKELREKINRLVMDTEECPNCDNTGHYAGGGDEDGFPEEIQCEFCYTNPNSKFNFTNSLLSLVAEALLDCFPK